MYFFYIMFYIILVLLNFIIHEGYLYPILLDFIHYLDNKDAYGDGMFYASGHKFDPIRDLNPDNGPQQPNPDGVGPSIINRYTNTDDLAQFLHDKKEQQGAKTLNQAGLNLKWRQAKSNELMYFSRIA